MTRLIRLVLLQICCLLVLSVNAQVKNNVVRLHAYIQETVAGNIEVDTTGTPVNTGVEELHQLYAETTGKYLPQWNVVYTNKGVFAIEATEIKSRKQEVGKLKSNKKTVHISAKRGNRLWKLELLPMKARIPAQIAQLLRKNEVVVITEWKGKQFTHTIAKEIELDPVFYE